MPKLPRSSLTSIPTSFATCSLGYKESHTLPLKLTTLATAGFTGIELAFPDLVSFASLHHKKPIQETDYPSLLTAAREVKSLCAAANLEIMLLQPFANFEGWAEGSPERKDAFERARGWISVMVELGCRTLQVGSSDTPASKIGMDRGRFVEDLRQLADLLAEHDLRLAYENWCWSTHAPAWFDVWDIIRRVDRPNAGLCLDTFQTAGGEWGDPSTASGVLEPAFRSREEVEVGFRESMERLAKEVPADKIYLLQISDAYKLETPITEADGDGLRPRGRWSHDFRPVPFKGGYLPVVGVARAVLGTGFRGWFSYEVFDSGPDGKGKEYELGDFADEAFACQEKLLDACAE